MSWEELIPLCFASRSFSFAVHSTEQMYANKMLEKAKKEGVHREDVCKALMDYLREHVTEEQAKEQEQQIGIGLAHFYFSGIKIGEPLY